MCNSGHRDRCLAGSAVAFSLNSLSAQVEKVIRALRYRRERATMAEVREELTTLPGTFRRNRHRMQYATMRKVKRGKRSHLEPLECSSDAVCDDAQGETAGRHWRCRVHQQEDGHGVDEGVRDEVAPGCGSSAADLCGTGVVGSPGGGVDASDGFEERHLGEQEPALRASGSGSMIRRKSAPYQNHSLWPRGNLFRTT